jgi:predicted CXXCH cytochrome family protein
MTPTGEVDKRGFGAGFIKTISFLFLLVIFSGIILVDTVSAQADEGYVGAEACKPCHSKIYESWTDTRHSLERGSDECHTTGRYPDGSPILKGIQCEMCHTAGAEHVKSADPEDILINWSANLCGRCHRTSHHPQWDEWEESGHAKSLRADHGLAARDSKCTECHVSQAIVSRFKGKEMGVDADPEPVDCQTCHDPHGSPNELQLRFPAKELCSKCHNTEGAEVGGKEFHPQSEMFSGSIMHEFGISCYDCHRYVKVYESEIYPEITGHSFEPRREQCVTSGCHPEKDVNWAKNAVRLEQAEIITMLEEAEEEIGTVDSVLLKMYPSFDGSKESIGDAPPGILEGVDKYEQAKFNYEFVKRDRSLGVHNRKKAEHMLEEVEPLTEGALELIRKSVLEGGGTDAGAGAKGICGPTSLLLFALVPVLIKGGRRER